MWQTAKKHKWAVLAAITLGILIWLPGWLKVYTFADWQGIYPQINDDEVYYHARAQDIQEGYYFLVNPYLYEHKSGAPMQFWLPDFLLAKPLALLGIDHWLGYRLYDLFLPIISFLLAYAIFYVVSGLPWLSIGASAWLFGAVFLSLFNRSPSPQFSFIFWLALALSLFVYLSKRKRIYLVGAAASLGLLFNLYPYYWTFYLVVLFIFLPGEYWLAVKKKGAAACGFIRDWSLMLLAAFILGLPYWWGFWQSRQLPFYSESLQRLGMISTHFPSAIKIVAPGVLLMFIFGWLWRRRQMKFDSQNWLLFSGVVAAVLVSNQHLITGQNLEFSSHYYLGSIFWFTFAAIYLIKVFYLRLQPKWQWQIKLLLGAVIGLLVFLNISQTLSKQLVWRQVEVSWQRYGPVMAWLKQSTLPDEVIFTSDELSSLIPAYTNNNVFYAREANLFFIKDSEVKERFILNHFWDNFSDDFIKRHERAIWGTYYINRYAHSLNQQQVKRLLGIKSQAIERLPAEEITKLRRLANELKAEKFEDQVKKYRLDYIIWDSYKQPNWQLDGLPLKKLWQWQGIIIYKFND